MFTNPDRTVQACFGEIAVFVQADYEPQHSLLFYRAPILG